MNAPIHPAILQVQDLSFAYADQPPLAQQWSARIGAGVTLLHGDTGSGKSTLLRVLAGELPAGAGRLTLAGAPLDTNPSAYRRQVFWCEPATQAFDPVTARTCTASLSTGDAGFSETEWLALVEGFGLAPHLDKPLCMLSTGSKRKVWLAAALASGRALVLLDEPSGALDAPSLACLWRALARCAQRVDQAVIVASAGSLEQVPLVASIVLPLA